MMAYKNNFAIAIKHNGKILRELSELVYLPFGSEYSVLLKNKDSRKAVVDLEIDGKDVLDGNSIIVGANDSVELKGFMKGSTAKNKFKFIKKTKKIRNYRGNRIDDSLVRVEYRFEQPPAPTPIYWYDTPMGYRDFNREFTCVSSPTFGASLNSTNISCNLAQTKSMDDGITVEGTEINQGFARGTTGELETQSSVITLKLVGNKPADYGSYVGKLVKKPLTVKSRLTCKTCGTKSKSSAKFCRECSTFLR